MSSGEVSLDFSHYAKMNKETAWDYLFYSYKANLPLKGNYRNNLDKLHKAVNTIVEIELNRKDSDKGWVCDVVDDLKRIVSQNKSEQECYKDILSYIYKEGKDVKK